MFVTPNNDSDWWEFKGTLTGDNCTPVGQRRETTILDNVRLDAVVIESLVRLKFLAPSQSLAWSVSDDPIVSTIDNDDTRMVILHVDLAASDLAKRIDLPFLLNNSVQWLARVESSARTSYNTDEIVWFPGDTEAVNRVHAVESAGWWSAVAGAPIPVNLEELSETAPRAPDANSDTVIPEWDLQAFQSQRAVALWPWLIAVVAAIWMFDWYFLRRKRFRVRRRWQI